MRLIVAFPSPSLSFLLSCSPSPFFPLLLTLLSSLLSSLPLPPSIIPSLSLLSLSPLPPAMKKVKHRLVEKMNESTADSLGLSRAVLVNGRWTHFGSKPFSSHSCRTVTFWFTIKSTDNSLWCHHTLLVWYLVFTGSVQYSNYPIGSLLKMTQSLHM